jgi:two-component system, OmpR family, sensor kinase
MKLPLHSLRWRIQLWHGAILFLVIGALCIFANRFLEEERMQHISQELRTYERLFVRRVILRDKTMEETKGIMLTEEEVRAALAEYQSNPIGMDPDYYIIVWDQDHKPLINLNYPGNPAAVPSLQANPDEKVRYTGQRLEMIHPNPHGMVTIIGKTISKDLTELAHIRLWLGLSGLGLWLVGMLGGWFYIGRAISPLKLIRQAAQKFSEGDLTVRIRPNHAVDELSEVCHALNTSFDQLERIIQQQKQFIADASHELRTPLTILLSEVQRGLKRERDAEGYQEILRTCSRVSERMKELVNSLLTLVRQDLDSGTQAMKDCEMDQLVSECVTLQRPLAEQKSIYLSADIRPGTVHGVENDLRILISNLIGNALQHCPEHSHVQVSLHPVGGSLCLQVKDDGPGIPIIHQPFVFNRFYQVNSARSGSGHSGLGLAIVKGIAERHHGHVELTSEEGKGASFLVWLPREIE